MLKHLLLASTIVGGIAFLTFPASAGSFGGTSLSLNASIGAPVTSDLMIQVKGGKGGGHKGGAKGKGSGGGDVNDGDDDDQGDVDDNDDNDDQGDDNDDQGDDGDDDTQ